MDLQAIKARWQHFMETGIIDKETQPVVAASWKKCRERGIDPYIHGGNQVSSGVFKKVLERNDELIRIARPVMKSVYNIIRDSHFLLVLTDRAGYVLETIGDDSILERSENILFRTGSIWSELDVGSNAPGIALEYDTPIQMNGAEHYCVSQHNWTCSAAPIHSLDGSVIGCLDLSGAVEAAHPHTLALVVAGAFSVESLLAMSHQTQLMRTAADGLHEAVLMLDEHLQLRWSNTTAEKEFGLSELGKPTIDFRHIMPDVDWDTLLQLKHQTVPLYMNDMRFVLPKQTQRLSAAVSVTVDASGRTITVILRKQEHLIRSVNQVSGNQATYTFADIFAVDPIMKQVLERARQYAGYDGSVLIEGDSGTGKELFAQAIHKGSSRADGPFVAVNCASLPRDLIESELFGYEKGSFTGALKEGNPGKFELANHGTLFLDEIGEMPMEFQAKLLRAVETLRIRRIGGKEEKRLDVRVVAATNRNLKHQVELGLFRGDLYYRLNVLKLDIPPLRERPDDVAYCANQFLQRFNQRYPNRKRKFSSLFLQALKQYDWPGNVRELQNSIERVFYTSELETITTEDLRHVMDGARISLPHSENVHENMGAGDEEWTLYSKALEQNGGNVAAAARAIGVSVATFYRLCKKYDIRPKKIRRRHVALEN